MSPNLDQQALDLIDTWEAGAYLHPAQKKAALQVAIRDALAQARAEGMRQAAMSDREKAQSIVDRIQSVDDLVPMLATALAQARAEGLRQAAEVADKERIKQSSYFAQCYSRAATVIAANIRALAEGGE